MVGVAQLAERWFVEPDVAGSSPVVHPKLLEGLCLNERFKHLGYDERKKLVFGSFIE
jgi:hypothetical protein